MSHIYTGTPNYTNSITIPDDGDLAASASVGNPTTSEADMDYFILQTIGYLPSTPCSISMYSTDTTSININPVSCVVVTYGGQYRDVYKRQITILFS